MNSSSILFLLLILPTALTIYQIMRKNPPTVQRPSPFLSKKVVPHSSFKNDSDILRYLALFNRGAMIWSCKNALHKKINRHHPVQHFELFCSVIGDLKAVVWMHNHKMVLSKSDIGVRHSHVDRSGRWTQVISPHVNRVRRHVFSHWTDLRLRVSNATTDDSGLYLFKVSSGSYPNVDQDRQYLFVDIENDRQPL